MTMIEVVLTRWQCPRGHFVAESSLRCEDIRDDFAYYGVRTECQYLCRSCERTYDGLPRIIEIGRSEVEVDAQTTGGTDANHN